MMLVVLSRWTRDSRHVTVSWDPACSCLWPQPMVGDVLTCLGIKVSAVRLQRLQLISIQNGIAEFFWCHLILCRTQPECRWVFAIFCRSPWVQFFFTYLPWVADLYPRTWEKEYQFSISKNISLSKTSAASLGSRKLLYTILWPISGNMAWHTIQTHSSTGQLAVVESLALWM